jgi:hypothetical protein
MEYSFLGLIESLTVTGTGRLAGTARFVGNPLAEDPWQRQAVTVGGYTATAMLFVSIGRDP